MSVMVNGMNMPESCLSCPFQEWDGEDTLCYFTGISALNIGRQGDCPLVEVPTPHGRLIDADVLLASENQHYEIHSDSFYVESRTIELSPTIIEAEEGE